jgi:hypothetical protein
MMTTIECDTRSIEDERKSKKYTYDKAWKSKNKDKVNAQKRAYYHANKGKWRDADVLKRYGLTKDAWDALFLSQGRCCAVCRSDSPRHKHGWATDHCHTTGVVRGVLCQPCNLMLGHSDDSTSTLSNAISYLNRFKQ